jgi:hypothetical protein
MELAIWSKMKAGVGAINDDDQKLYEGLKSAEAAVAREILKIVKRGKRRNNGAAFRTMLETRDQSSA